jgi:uncharacterized protein involved in exopolysaccharide biosynthesis
MTHVPTIGSLMLRQPAPEPAARDDDEISIGAILRIVRRRIGLIVAVAALAMLAATPLILSMEREYYASTRILIKQPLARSFSSPEMSREALFDLGAEIERLGSRHIAERVVQALALDRVEEFNPALRPTGLAARVRTGLRTLLLGSQPDAAGTVDPIDAVVESFFEALAIRRGSGSDVVEIGFSSRDAELAAQVPNLLLRFYLEERSQGVATQVVSTKQWLLSRLEVQRERVESAATAVRAFRDANALGATEADPESFGAASALGARRAAIAQSRAELTAAVAAMELSAADDASVPMLGGEDARPLRAGLDAARARLARLLEIFGENHQDVIAARAEIRALEEALRAERDGAIAAARLRLETLDREEASVVAALEAARDAETARVAARARLEDLQRVAKMEQSALDALTLRWRALEQQADVPASEIEVLFPAATPREPAGRSKLFYLLAAMVAAGGVGLTAAFAREAMDRSVRSVGQISGRARLTLAGLAPTAPRRGPGRLSELLRRGGAGPLSDAMREVALSLEHAGDGRPPRSLLVTSALPGEGKSTVATALALEMAASGQRTLLVDADLWRGAIHALVGAPPGPGLAEFLSGAAPLAETIHASAAPGLRVMPKGKGKGTLFGAHARLADVFAEAAHAGEVVVVNSPPLLATTDAARLARLCERTLLVIRWGRTGLDPVELAVDRIVEAGRIDIPVLFNQVDPARYRLYGFREAGVFSRELRAYRS